MRKIDKNNLYMVHNYIIQKSKNKRFSMSLNKIAEDIGFKHSASVKNYIDKLLEMGLLIEIESGYRGGNPAIYEVRFENNVVEKINFEGVEIDMKQTDIGSTISKTDLAFATLELDSSIIDKIIQSNKEQFEHNIISIDGEDYINRKGIVLYLTKLNLDKVSPLKRKTLNEFQTLIATKMMDLIVIGKVEFTEGQKIKITHNLGNLTDIDLEDIEAVFGQIEDQMTEMYKRQDTEIENMTNCFERERDAKHRALGTKISMQ